MKMLASVDKYAVKKRINLLSLWNKDKFMGIERRVGEETSALGREGGRGGDWLTCYL